MHLRILRREEQSYPVAASCTHHHTPIHLEQCVSKPLLLLMLLCNPLEKLTLQLDLILSNERLALVCQRLSKFGRDGVMGSLVFDHKALVAVDAL